MKMSLKNLWQGLSFGILFLTLSTVMAPAAHAKSAAEIDASVDTALKRLEWEVKGARSLVKGAKGILILPKVIKGGIGIGGEYGEGALRINGKTVDYYSTVGGSFGFQLGAQIKDIYLLFMEDAALLSSVKVKVGKQVSMGQSPLPLWARTEPLIPVPRISLLLLL